jgi:DNA mismatch repair ATPase MutS
MKTIIDYFKEPEKNYGKITENINEQDKQQILTDLFGQLKETSKTNIYKDLEIFEDREGNNDDSIYSKINNTQTIYGDYFLKKQLYTIQTERNKLTKLQDIVKQIAKDDTMFNQLDSTLCELKQYEIDMLWLWKTQNKETTNYLDQVYFSGFLLETFNENELVLKLYNLYQIIVAPAINIISPIVFVIIPYLFVNQISANKIDMNEYFNILNVAMKENGMMGGNISGAGGAGGAGGTGPSATMLKYTQYITVIMWCMYYVHSIYVNVVASRNINKIINIIHEKINRIALFVKKAYQINCQYFQYFDCEKIERICENLWLPLFETNPQLLSDKGKILITYKQIIKRKNDFKIILEFIGKVDMFVSIAKLIRNNKEKLQNGFENMYSFPVYIPSNSPVCVCKNIWNPCIEDKKVVMNDIILNNKEKKNAMITGPNAGGKSTFIKSVALSVLLSQTLGITCCKEQAMTIFKKIETYLNIPDIKGKESLFEAEVNRALEYITDLNELSSTDFSFIVMDEIFNSTNPEEGVAGGYSICKKISSFQNNISIITTHFTYLTKLEQNTENFCNYKLPIVRQQETNSIMCPYKITKGVSDQFIAIELLRDKGFDSEIIEEALEICKEIQETAKNNLKSVKIKSKKTKSKKIKKTKEINQIKNIKKNKEVKDNKEIKKI